MKKGSPLMVEVLDLCMTPRTVGDVFKTLGCDERVARLLMWELNESGLLERVGHRKPANGGNNAVLYQTSFVEGEVFGRVQTRRFIRLWNGLFSADSVENIAADIGAGRQAARRGIKLLYDARLCHISLWQRNRVSIPTAIYAIGRARDATRPSPRPMAEYNRRANAIRKLRDLSNALVGNEARP